MEQQLPTGDSLHMSRDAAVITFTGNRTVLSTGNLGGGLRKDLRYVYNHNDCPGAGAWCKMQGETMIDHQRYTAKALGLDPDYTTGIHTAANMNNASIHTLKHGSYTVTALITAGIDVNGTRVGNPAPLDEEEGKTVILGGTINIILIMDADVTDHGLARGLVTATEAKVAALQELLARDCYSKGLATGSGTDGLILIANRDSPVKLAEAGKSFKLGELIGKVVKRGVKEALYRQSGLSPQMQHQVFRRLDRFGVTPKAVWQEYLTQTKQPMDQDRFTDLMHKMAVDGFTVTYASLYAHLMDQLLWDLLLPQEAVDAGNHLLEEMNRHHGMPKGPFAVQGESKDATTDRMAKAFVDTIVRWTVESDGLET